MTQRLSPSSGFCQSPTTTITALEQPFLDKAIALADAITKFKTPEMEKVFAMTLEKAANPLMVARE